MGLRNKSDKILDVSIIIVNYNTVNLVIDAINSIFEKTEGILYEVIIVDNNSSDNSQFILEQKYNNRIIYLSLSENIGFGRANNEGLKIAKGRNILFLNPDTILINNAIKILSDYLDSNVSVGACGGNLFDEDMKAIHSHRMMIPSILLEISDSFSQIPEKIIYGKNGGHNFKNKPIPVAYITGADLMIKSSVIDKIKGFNPKFFMYYEDTDLCFRIKKAGYKMMSLPSAQIKHLEGKSFEEKMVNRRKISFIESGRRTFFSENYSPFYNFIANSIAYTNIIFRIFFFKMSRSPRLEYWKVRREEFKF